MTATPGPSAWKAADVQQDTSWIQRLTSDEVSGFRSALAHARLAMGSGKPLLHMTQADFPLPSASRLALLRAVGTTQGRWGMCLLRGLPTDEWSESEARVACWGIGLYLGVARPQNRASDVLGDVRDTGKSYTAPGGRGYNTNAGLDFHQDSCDVVALLCRRTAKSGGTSKVVSSIAVRERVQERHPELIPVLQSNDWFHSFQNAQDPEAQPPFYRCPIFGHSDTDTRRFLCARTNRKNIVAAQRDFPEVPRLKAEQHRALDVLDRIMADEEFCYSMELERGDMQLLNSFVTLHSRTPFEDYAELDKKRHLLRLWLAIPAGQPLPREWAEYWGDVRAGAVRGGVRGEGITNDFLSYERGQAEAMGMRFEPWKPVVRKDDVARILEQGSAREGMKGG
ncbi:hypothetical protein C8J57DRAFT_1325080 [Mycena rebaudengoi]|nr:hypothetical protein C8J57DRAFT_1325080 [Mycena rebaudengoi]